ncbi:NADH-cytochrome b5 reductase 1 [Penicillium canariense]|uniref:NADH-cytochrome b5 reductase 1 n=1 Tax=Penicillium canariense TaxID=189055 RepID=A0A9W9HSU0_9EURO|nr:NADH-cytochrome b5 reductase 1 [Penicillium canariense]KAJ5152804.1 NADH-cytochrome b5 reductase 1 [Penicillium canariense]
MATPETTELKAQWKTELVVPEYTMEDVAVHNTKADMWMVIHGQVFDITKYVQDHPGGADVLVEVAGQDATAAYEDVGHSEDAREIMQPYLVGTLADAQEYVRPKAVRVVSSTTPEKPKSASRSRAIVAGTLSAVLPALYICTRGSAHIFHPMGTVTRLLPSQLTTIRLGQGGFLNGLLAASLLCSAAGVALAKQASRFTQIESGFTKYPPHIHAKKVIHADPHLTHGFLEPKTYQHLPLVAKHQLSPNVYRFVFALPEPTAILGLPVGQHVAIKAEIDGNTVSRSYTPTSNNLDRGRLELVIKCYPDGLLTGRYLANLSLGDKVAFRGPKGAMKYTKGVARAFGMVAGGTGITPMYQLIRAICENDADTTQISLVYASHSEADILLREELDAFARRYPSNFKVWYVLSEAPEGWAFGKGYVDGQVLREHMPSPGPDTKILLCGPPGMISATKKNLAPLGFKVPGPVSKMSDEVFCF